MSRRAAAGGGAKGSRKPGEHSAPLSRELRSKLFEFETNETVDGIENRIEELRRRAKEGLPLFPESE